MKFSIVIPTYNRSELLPRAINSVLKQTFHDYELIIVDDCSTDNTQDILKTFQHPKLSVIRQATNQGVSAARNTGIQQAKGEYICFLDDDDAFLPDFLETTLKYLPNIDFVWCGKRIIKGAQQTEKIPHIGHSLKFVRSLSLNSGVTIKKSCFDKIGLFDTQLKMAEDLDVFLRLLSQGFKYTVIPSVHIEVFIHPGVSLSRDKNHLKEVESLERLIEKNKDFLNKHRILKNHYLRSLMGAYYRAGLVSKARKLVLQQAFSLKNIMRALSFEIKKMFS